MRKIAAYLSLLILCVSSGFSEAESLDLLKKNPGLFLNFQDAPIFRDGNPLTGLTAFAVLLPQSIRNSEINQKIRAVVEKELALIGTVIRTEPGNVNSFGTGNLLNIQVGPVSAWDENRIPVTRVTLNVETPALMTKSNEKCLPRVWTVNTFIGEPFDPLSQGQTPEAVGKLLREFVANYRYANVGRTNNPTFYLYF